MLHDNHMRSTAILESETVVDTLAGIRAVLRVRIDRDPAGDASIVLSLASGSEIRIGLADPSPQRKTQPNWRAFLHLAGQGGAAPDASTSTTDASVESLAAVVTALIKLDKAHNLQCGGTD